MPQQKISSFWDHFEELRARLMRCLWVFFGLFIICYAFLEPILAFLRKPLFDALPEEGRKLYYTSLFENFLAHLHIAGYAALFVGFPYFFKEIWGFVAPGLFPRERKLVIPFLIVGSILFVGGASFAYAVLFPIAFKFFATYGSASDVPMLTIGSYYSTAIKLMILFGAAFELPLAIALLGVLGVVQASLLREQRRNIIIGISVLAALFAPPDAVSMVLLGGPLILLVEIAILFVAWYEKRQKNVVAGEGL